MDLTGLNLPNGMSDISIKAASGGNVFQDVLGDKGTNLTSSTFGDGSDPSGTQGDTTTGSGSAEGNQIRLQAEGMRDEADALRDQAAALRE